MRSTRLVRSILACFLGPALGGLALSVIMTAYDAASGADYVRFGSAQDILFGIGSAAALPVVFGTLPMLLIGLPLQAWMSRRGLTQVYWYAPTAYLAGGLIAFAILPLGGPLIIAIGAAYGGFAGLFAWLIRRPDLDRRTDAQGP